MLIQTTQLEVIILPFPFYKLNSSEFFCLGHVDIANKTCTSVPLPPFKKKDGDTSLMRRVGTTAQQHKHLIIAVSLLLLVCLALYLVLLVWVIRAGSCRDMLNIQ